MLGKLAASILVPYLSKYVENVDAQKLNIDLWSGTARLQNLVLRREVLNELLEPPTDGSPTTGGQPSPSPSAGPRFRVHRGICTEVNLHIPLKRLRSEPVVIKVSELFITLTGVEDDEDEPRCGSSTHHRTSHYWDRVAMQKEAELERLDAERRAALEGGGPTCSGCADTSTTTAASGGVGASLTGYFSRLGEVVLNNIIIEVQTAHIRWEDRSQRTQLGVIVGPIRLANVCAETGGVGFSDPAGQPRVMKRLSFDGLQLYCEEVDATHHGATSTEEEEEARWLSTMEDLDAWTEAMRSRTDQGRQHHSTIVGPVGGQLDVALVLRSCMRKLLSTPYANVNLHLNPLATRLHRSQYVSLARALSRFTTSAPVDATSPSLPRPTEPPLLNPRAWWRYAIRRVRRDLLAPHREALLQRVSEACVMDYRVLFRDVARQMPMSAEKRKTYRFITRFMSVADMWAGRRHVYAQMANERQLRRNEHQLKEAGSPTGASSGGGSMPPKKQGWLSWMMGTQKKSADVAAEVAPFVDEDDLIRQLTAEYEVEPSEDAESASSPDLSPGEGAFQLVDRHLPATYCWVDLSVRLPQVRLCLELSEEEQIFFTLDHVAARMRSYNRQRSLQFAFALENLTITNPTATNLSSSRNSSSGASAIPNLVEGAPTPEDGEDGPMHLYSANSIVVGEHGLVFPPRAASSGSLDVVSCTQVMSPPHSSRGSSSTENHSDRDEEENVPEDGTTAGPPTTAAGVRRRHPVMDSLERHLQLSMEHSDCTARTATPQSLAGDAGHRTSRPLIDLCGAIFPAKPLLEDAPVDVALEVRVLPLRIIADPHTLEHLAAFVKLPREVDVSAVATRTRGAAQRVGHAASRELRTTIATTTHWLLTVEVAAPIVVLPKSLQTSAATSPALALSLGRVDLHRRPTPPSEKKEELYNRTVAQCRGLFVEMTTVEAALTTLGSGFMMLPEVSVEAEVLQLQPCVAMEPRGEKMDDFVLRLRIPRVQLACSLHQSYILADLLDAWRVYLQPQPTSPTLAASATPGRADGMRGPSSSSCPLLAPSPPARRDGVAEVADGDGDRSSSSPPPLHLRLEAFLEQVSLHIHEDERPSLQVAPTPRFCSTLQHTHLRLRMSPTSTEASVALRSIAVVDAKDASLPILSGAVVYASLLRRICGEANPSAPFPAGDGSSTSPVATSTPATPSAAVAASGSTTTAPAAASAEAAAPPVVRIRIKPSVVLRVGTPFTEMLEHVVDLSNVVMSVMQDGGYAGANSAQSPLVATTTIRDLDDDDDGGMEEEDVGSDVELRRQLLYMQKQCRTPDLPVVHLKLSMEGTHHVELYNRRRAADGTIDAHDTLFAITSATDVNLRMSRRAVTMEANASIGQVSLQLAESFPLHPRFSTVLHYTPHAHSRHTTGDDTSYHRGSSVSRTSSASLSPTPSRSVLSPVVSASPLTTSAFFNRQPTSLERSCRGGLPEVLNTSITSTSTGMMPHVSLGYRRAKPVMALFVEEDGERHLANPNDLRYSCALDVELGSSRIVMDPHSILLLHAYCTSGFLVRVMEVASRPLYNGRRLPPVHRPPPLLMSLRVVAHDCRVAVPVDARDGDSAIFTASMSHVVVQNSLNIMHGGHESTNISLREMALTSQTSSASAAAELLQPHAFVELAIRRPLDPLSDDVRQLDVRSEELALAMSATEVAGLVELLRGVQARGAVAPSESVAAPPGPSAAVEWASPTHEQRHQDPEGLAARADTTTTHHLSYREEPNLCVAAKIARLRFLLRDVDDAMRAEPGAAVELNAAGVSAVWSGVGNQTQLRWSVLEVLDARASCGRGAEPSSGAAATNTNNNSISLSSPALLVVEEGSMKYGDTLTTRSILMSDFGIRPTALASAEPGEADMMMASMSGTEALTLADLPPPPPPTLPSVEQDGNGDAPQSMELLRVSVLSADLAIRRFAITHQWRMLYDLLCRSNLVSAPTPSSQPNATPSTTDGPRHLRVLLTAPSIHVPFFSTSGDRILEAHLSSVLVDVAALSPSTRIALRVQHVELFDGLSGSTIFTKRRGGLDGLSSMLPSAREDEAGSPATTEHSPTTLPGDEMMMAAGGSLTAAEVFPSVPSGGGGGGLLRHATAGASLTSSAGDDVEVIHLHLQLEEDARRQVLRATLSAWEVLMAPPQLMGLLHYFGSPSEPVMMMYQLVTELTTVPATTPSASAVSVVSVGDASTSTSLQPWAIHVRMHQPRFILTSDNLDRHHRRSNYVEARMERVRVALTLLPRKDESGRASSSSMVVGAVVRLTDLAVPEVIERTSITARLARGGDGVERADVHLDRAMVMIHYTEVERLQRVLRGSLATPASPYYHCLALAPAVEVEVAATPSIVPCRHVVLHLEALTIALHDIVDINSHTVLATDLNLQLDMPSSSSTMLRASLMSVRVLEHFTTRALLTLGPKAGSTPTAAATSAPSTAIAVEMSVEGQRTDLGIRLGVMSVAVIPKGVAGLANLILAMQHLIPDASEESTTSTINPDNTTSMLHAQCDCEEFQIRLVQRSGKDVALLRLPRIAAHATVGAVLEELGLTLPSLVMHDRFSTNTRYPDIIYAVARDGDAADATSTTQPTQPWMELHISHHNNTTTQAPTQSEGEATVEPPRPQVRLVMGSMSYVVVPAILSSIQAVVSETIILVGDRTRELRSGHYSTHHRGVGGGSTRSLAPLTPTAAATTAASSSGWPLWLDPLPSLDIRIQNQHVRLVEEATSANSVDINLGNIIIISDVRTDGNTTFDTLRLTTDQLRIFILQQSAFHREEALNVMYACPRRTTTASPTNSVSASTSIHMPTTPAELCVALPPLAVNLTKEQVALLLSLAGLLSGAVVVAAQGECGPGGAEDGSISGHHHPRRRRASYRSNASFGSRAASQGGAPAATITTNAAANPSEGNKERQPLGLPPRRPSIVSLRQPTPVTFTAASLANASTISAPPAQSTGRSVVRTAPPSIPLELHVSLARMSTNIADVFSAQVEEVELRCSSTTSQACVAASPASSSITTTASRSSLLATVRCVRVVHVEEGHTTEVLAMDALRISLQSGVPPLSAEEEATSLSAPEVPTTTTLEGGPAMHLNDASVEVERCALSFAPRILADAHELLLQPYYEKLLCRPSRPMAALRICGPATRVVLERDLQLEAWQVLHISQGADGACCYVLDLNHNQLLLRGPPSPQIILDDGCDLTIINGSVVLPCMVSLSSFVRFGPATALHVESTCRIVKLFAGRASLAESGVVGAGTTMELPSSGAVVIGRGSGGGTTRRGVAARPAVQVLFSMRSREVSVRLCLDGGSTNVPLSLHMSVAAQWAGELEDGRYTRSSGGVQVVGLRTGTCEEHVLLPTTLEANLSAEGGRLHVELAMDVVSLTVRMSHVGHLIRGVHDCLAALQIGNVDEDEEEVMANEASTPRAVVRWRDVAPVPVVLESEALVPLVLAATAGDCTRCGAIGLATLTEKPTRNNAADEEDEEEEESVGRWCSACCRGESNGFGQLLATADMHVDVREVDVLLLGSPALFAQVALRNARARREAAGDAHVEGQISAHVFSFSCAMWEPVVEHLDVVVDGSSANYRLSFPRCMFCCSPHGLATLSGLWEDACQAENRCTSASAVRGIVSAPRRAPLPYAEVLLRNATSSTLHVPCTNTTVPPGKSATTIIASESVMMLHLCHTGGAVEDEEEAIPCSLRAPPRYARGPGVVLAAHLSLHSPHTSSSTSSVAQRRVRLSIYPIHAATESLVRIINRLHCRVRFARGMADVEAGEWAYLPSTVNHRAALLVQPIPNNNKQDEEKEEDASAPSTVGLSLESLLRTRSCSTTSVAHDGGPTPVELHLTTLDAGLRAGVPCYDILVEAPLTLHNQLPYVVEISLSRGRDADRRMTEQLQRTQPIVVEPNVQASLPFFVGPHSLTSVCITMRVRLAVYGSGGASKNNHDDADVGVEMYESDAMSWSGTSSTTSWSHMCCLRSDGPSPQVMNLRLSRHDTCFSIMSPFIVRNATPLRLTIRECDANGDVVLAKERPCFAELPPDMKIGLPATSSAASQGSNTNELCVNVYHGSTSAKRIPLHALQHGLILLEEISSTPKTATNSNSSSSTEVRPTTFHLAYQSTLGSDGSMYVLITPRWMIVNRSLRPLYVIPTTPAAPRIIAAAREGLLPSCAAPAEGNDDGIANEPSTPLEATTPTTAAALASCALRVEAHTSAALLALPSIRGELCASIVLGLEDQRYGTPLSLEAIQSARVLLYAATQPSYEGGGGAYVECSLAARGACTYLTLEDAPHHPYDVINRSCFTLRVLDVSVQCPRRLMAEVAPGCRAPLMLDASITTVVEMELLEEVHPSAESVVAHHYFMDVARCTRAEKEGEPTKAVDCETNTTKAPVIEVKASYTAGGRHLVEVRGNTLEAPSSSSSLRPQLLHLNAAPATPFTLQVAVALLSLSVVMPGQELLHAVAMELRLSWQREATRERWSASITNFQVDNEVEEVPHYPAALFSIRRSSEESAVACCVVRDLLPGLHHPQMLCLDEVRVDVLPIALRVSDVLLVALARFVQSLEANHIRPHDDDDDDDGDDVDVRGEGVRRIGASSMEDDVPPPIPASPPLHLVLRRIIINPLQLRLWLSREPMDDEMRAFVEESLSSRHAALLARLMASCADIMITAPGLVRLRWDGRLSLFGAWLRASYVEVLLAQLHGVLLQYASSLPLIGAPLKLASALQSGAVRCFKDPVQGILTSPKAFAEGLASASVGMLHDMTAASLAAMANLSESGARLLSLGGGVSEQERRSLGTYAGLVRGLRGVVQRPMEGVAEGGAAGFVKGTAQGLLGAIASPAAGLLSDVARSTGTMAQLVDERYLPPTTRLREPRVFLAGGAVGPLGAVRSTRETQRIDLRTGRYASTNLRGDGDPPAWDAGKPEEVMFHGVRLARSAWSMDRRHTTHDGWSYAATSAGPFRRTTAPETARLRRRRWATLVEPLPYSASAAAHHLVAGRALSRRPLSSHFVPSPMTTSVGTEEVMRNMDAGAEEPLVAYALPGVVEVSPREEGEGPRVPLTRGPAAPGAGMVSAAPPTHPPHHRHALLPPPPSRRSSATMSSAPPEPPSTSVVEVYELERRAPLLGWVKSWLPPDCPAWQDHRGCAIDGKEAVAPPVGWRWAGPWKVAATQSGSGWVELPTEPEGGRAKLRRRAWQRPVERITTSSNKTVVAGSDAVSSAH